MHHAPSTHPKFPNSQQLSLPTTSLRQPTPVTFRGLVTPEMPKAPEPDECCVSSCAVYVHDLFQELLDVYKTAVASVRASLMSLGVPME
ncbi:hypothetical protein BJY52DRAFT_1119031 [Lactarius psammicola]|nr:hypothetical protein BJY52DRAFT_1119031 [Lactarius psammicola]